MNIEQHKYESFQPPHKSKATRQLSWRSKASLRGTLVAQLPADDHPRGIVFESKLEQRFLYITLARNDVHDVWDQPPAVIYRNAKGRTQTHTFDYLVTFKTGERTAIAVKPMAKVIKYNFIAELKLISNAMNKQFARRIVLITDQHFTKDEALNAAHYHTFSKVSDLEADHRVTILARELPGSLPLGVLIAQVGLVGRAYGAIIRAIYNGSLKVNLKERITFDTHVSRGDGQ